MTARDCPACYTCASCNRPTCRDEHPSPCETHQLCADCCDLPDGAQCETAHADELLRDALRGWGAAS